MEHGDISNQVGPWIAVDFEALLLYPEDVRHQLWIERLDRWSNRRYLGRIFATIRRVLQPLTLTWYKLSPDAERVFWWFHANEYRIAVLVRRPYCGTLPGYGNLVGAVERLLGDFPSQRFHLIHAEDLGKQAYEINSFCRTFSVLRFFTSDERLFQNNLSRRLAVFVMQWDESVVNQ